MFFQDINQPLRIRKIPMIPQNCKDSHRYLHLKHHAVLCPDDRNQTKKQTLLLVTKEHGLVMLLGRPGWLLDLIWKLFSSLITILNFQQLTKDHLKFYWLVGRLGAEDYGTNSSIWTVWTQIHILHFKHLHSLTLSKACIAHLKAKNSYVILPFKLHEFHISYKQLKVYFRRA